MSGGAGGFGPTSLGGLANTFFTQQSGSIDQQMQRAMNDQEMFMALMEANTLNQQASQERDERTFMGYFRRRQEQASDLFGGGLHLPPYPTLYMLNPLPRNLPRSTKPVRLR